MCQGEKTKKLVLIKLGENIRSLRLKRGISQEELAFKIDSARNFVGCIERAEKSPTIYTLFRIAQALNVRIVDIVENIDEI